MSFGKVVVLSTGASLPQIGLGTWQAHSKEVESAESIPGLSSQFLLIRDGYNQVEIALRNGYRHFDLAHVYQNQREIGAALRKLIPSVAKREEIFVTGKLWNSSHQPAEVPKELDVTLNDLGLDYLDLYLIHWPVAFVPGNGLLPLDPQDNTRAELDLHTSLVDTWKAMLALPKSKVRALGVSNFTVEQLKGIIAATGVVPAVNQIEAHPLLPQDDLVAFCKEHNIHITAYSPLGNNSIGLPMLTEHPVVKEMAQKLGATEAQVLIAWGAHRGYSIIPKSAREDRIKSNFQQIQLTPEDYESISSIKGTNETRFNIPCRYNPRRWDISIFGAPEEAKASNKVKVL